MCAMEELRTQIQLAIQSGVQITEIAARAGCSRQHIHNVVTGKQVPSLTQAEKIANAIGFSLGIRKLKKKSEKIPA